MYQKIHDALRNGHLVLTPNDRLAKSVKNTYLQTTVAANFQCYSLSQWLRRSYKQLEFSQTNTAQPILLNSFQVQYLLHSILSEYNNLLIHAGMMSSILEAWQYCKIYNM